MKKTLWTVFFLSLFFALPNMILAESVEPAAESAVLTQSDDEVGTHTLTRPETEKAGVCKAEEGKPFEFFQGETRESCSGSCNSNSCSCTGTLSCCAAGCTACWIVLDELEAE